MPRIMGIDFGEVRIGIALTDPLKIISSGFATYKNNNNIHKSIYELCKLKEVESIVIGMPLNQHSDIGSTAKKVINFAKELHKYFKENNFDIIFYEQDERYSTFEAHDILKKMNVKRKNKKNLVDQIAASTILSNFINNKNKKILDLN